LSGESEALLNGERDRLNGEVEGRQTTAEVSGGWEISENEETEMLSSEVERY
jgi:hypothetical protein